MKNIVSILLAFLFLVTTSGMGVTFHHCKMKGTSVSLALNPKSCCGKTMSGCCENETKVFKVKENYLSSASCTLPNVKVISTIFLAPNFISTVAVEKRNYFLFTPNHAPPESSVSLSILHRVILV